VQPGRPRSWSSCGKATPDNFLEALKPYGGTVLQTSLSHGEEEKLMQALHGDDRSAVTWEQPGGVGRSTAGSAAGLTGCRSSAPLPDPARSCGLW